VSAFVILSSSILSSSRPNDECWLAGLRDPLSGCPRRKLILLLAECGDDLDDLDPLLSGFLRRRKLILLLADCEDDPGDPGDFLLRFCRDNKVSMMMSRSCG
jgi:hypothetical protein